MAIDPALGFLFGSGAGFGFGASLVQNAAGTVDMEFATVYPPTGRDGDGTTGGTLAAGTYYATVSTTIDNCTHQSPESVQSSGCGNFRSEHGGECVMDIACGGTDAGSGLLRESIDNADADGREILGAATEWRNFCIGSVDHERGADGGSDGVWGDAAGFVDGCSAPVHADFAGNQSDQSAIQPGCERKRGGKFAKRRAEGGAVCGSRCGSADQCVPDGRCDDIKRVRCARADGDADGDASHHDPGGTTLEWGAANW